MTLPQEEFRELHKRWYQLTDNALEIFLTNGKTCLFAFSSSKVNMQRLSISLIYDTLFQIIFVFEKLFLLNYWEGGCRKLCSDIKFEERID